MGGDEMLVRWICKGIDYRRFAIDEFPRLGPWSLIDMIRYQGTGTPFDHAVISAIANAPLDIEHIEIRS